MWPCQKIIYVFVGFQYIQRSANANVSRLTTESTKCTFPKYGPTCAFIKTCLCTSPPPTPTLKPTFGPTSAPTISCCWQFCSAGESCDVNSVGCNQTNPDERCCPPDFQAACNTVINPDL